MAQPGGEEIAAIVLRAAGPPAGVEVEDLNTEVGGNFDLFGEGSVIQVAEVGVPGVVLDPGEVRRERRGKDSAVKVVLSGGGIVEIAGEGAKEGDGRGPGGSGDEVGGVADGGQGSLHGG